MFDLNIFSFPITNSGKPTHPGFLILPPPRKSARGRENDIFIIYFKLSGKSSITDEGLRTWLEKKGENYHQSAGTVTSGMRTFVEDINSDLLERNSRFAKQNGQISGSLQVMVLKKDMLYLTVCGAGQTFLLKENENEHIIDNENNGRGLGITQSVNVRFKQVTVENGNVILFVNDPPEFWNTGLPGDSQGLSNDALFRRLFSQSIGQAQGTLIRFRDGTGRITLLKSRPVENGISPNTTDEIQAPPQNESEEILKSVEPISAPDTDEINAGSHASVSRPFIDIPVDSSPEIQKAVSEGFSRVTDPAKSESRQVTGSEGLSGNPLPTSDNIKTAVGRVLRKSAKAKNQTETWLKKGLQRILPGSADQPLKLSKPLLIFIAIAIPAIIVAIAASLYIRNGRNSLFDGYLAEASQLSVRADSQEGDLASRLASLQESLYWLDKADQYGQSDQSIQLRQQVQDKLDDLEGTKRIKMIPAVNETLPGGTKFTQLAVSGTDLYALDSSTGKVLRFFSSGSEYQQDGAFDCGPNSKNAIVTIGKLVDMVPISINNTYGASLLAIDAQGMIEYCVPGESGYVVSLAAPDMGWVAINSISLNQGNLYVLDVKGNAVYKFEGKGDLFQDKPTLFFDDVIPNLTEAIDVEVVGYELYILRSNGQMVECTYSALKDMKSTECEDPAIFKDNRSGSTKQTEVFSGTSFNQMRLTFAPDSSLYLLDTAGKSIFHLSYARNLQGVMHPRLADGENLDNYSPTAFAVSSARQVFIAFGSLIYYGQMP